MIEQSSPRLGKAMSRYWVMSILIIGVFVAVSGIVAFQVSPRMQATATVGLRTPQPNNVLVPGVQGDASLARYTTQRSRFVTSDAVVSAVADELGRDDVTELRRDIQVTASPTSNIITIVAEADDRQAAVDLSRAITDAYGTQTERQVRQLTNAAIRSLETKAEQLRDEIRSNPGSDSASGSAATTLGELEIQMAELEASSALLGDGIEFVVASQVESVSAPGLPIREMAIGFVLGLAVAATAAWLRADRDRRVTDPLRVSTLLSTPFLGQISSPIGGASHLGELVGLPQHDYRMIWTAMSRGAPSGVIVVESVGTDMSSVAAANLAAAAAREELNVLVVDADVAVGRMSELFGHRIRAGGVSELLAQQRADWQSELTVIEAENTYQFSLLPAGPAVEEVDVSRSWLQLYVDEWRARFDYVFIVTEPFSAGQLAAKFAGAADGVFVVAGSGVDESELQDLRRQAVLQDVHIIGVAFTAGPARQRPWRSRVREVIDQRGNGPDGGSPPDSSRQWSTDMSTSVPART